MTNPNSGAAKLLRALLPYQPVPYWATPPLPPSTVTIRFRLDSDRPVFESEGTVTKIFELRAASAKRRGDA